MNHPIRIPRRATACFGSPGFLQLGMVALGGHIGGSGLTGGWFDLVPPRNVRWSVFASKTESGR